MLNRPTEAAKVPPYTVCAYNNFYEQRCAESCETLQTVKLEVKHQKQQARHELTEQAIHAIQSLRDND